MAKVSAPADVQSAAYDFRKAKAGPKKLRSIEMQEAENGGHIVTHRFENNGPVYHDSEDFVFGKGQGDKLLAHVAKHMGIPGAKEEVGEKEHMGKGEKEEGEE